MNAECHINLIGLAINIGNQLYCNSMLLADLLGASFQIRDSSSKSWLEMTDFQTFAWYSQPTYMAKLYKAIPLEIHKSALKIRQGLAKLQFLASLTIGSGCLNL